jgi:hypothetical protein
MKSLKENYQKLINALSAAYHDKDKVPIEVSTWWQTDVMRDIRRLGPLNAKASSFLFADRFVWRFAAVACMIALMLSIYVVYTGFNPETEIVNLFLDNPVEFTLVQAFGG